MGKKRSREEAKDVPPADGGADRMDEDSSDEEVRRVEMRESSSCR
jgi:protein BCP1